MSKLRQKRLDAAKIKLLWTVPFYAPSVARLPVVWDESILSNGQPTAATNGREIRWHPAAFDATADLELCTVLCHESEHCLRGHLWRAPAICKTDRDAWERWNVATDHGVNLGLKEFSALVMAKRLADPLPFPPPPESFLADPKYAGMSEEAIFAALPIKPPGGGGGAGGGIGRRGKADPHSMPAFGQMIMPGDKQAPTPAELERLAIGWGDTLIQSVNMAKGRGEVPAGLCRLVDSIVSPKVPWYELLRAFLRELAADDWDFMRPDLNFAASGFLLPSLRSERCGPVVFATDTSGSIDNEMLAQFQAEKQSCLDELKPSGLVDIYCDTKVHKVAEYVPGDVITREAPGGGGTSFEPVFEHCDKLAVPPRCLVYLTDLDGSFPAEVPDYPVIWVTWTERGKAPFGEVIVASIANS